VPLAMGPGPRILTSGWEPWVLGVNPVRLPVTHCVWVRMETCFKPLRLHSGILAALENQNHIFSLELPRGLVLPQMLKAHLLRCCYFWEDLTLPNASGKISWKSS
jgi:hypothetical protein